MIEPVFYNDVTREFEEKPTDKKLKDFLKLLRKPNATDTKNKFFDKAVKNYAIFGVAYFAFVVNTNYLMIRIFTCR